MKKIYKIINVLNNKIYIGKTIDKLEQRLAEHRQEARRYEKCIRENSKFGYNTKLYKAMVKYGISNFIIELVENVPENIDIDLREKYWIKLYKSQDDNIGYNIAAGGKGGSIKGQHRHSDAMKRQQSETQSGKKWYNNGTIEIMVFKNRPVPEGFKLGRIYKGLSGKDNPMYGKTGHNFGKKMSEETRQKLSISKKEKAKLKKLIWVNNKINEICIDLNRENIPDGYSKGRLPSKSKLKRKVAMYDADKITHIETFDSIAEASRKSNVSHGSILACCSGRTKTAGGYFWKFLN